MVETSLTSFQRNICRTCLRKISSSDSIGIFSDKQFYKNQTLRQVFMETTHSLIDPTEMLPVNVCLNCAEKFKWTVAFKKTIEKADRTLRYKLRLVEMRHSMKKIASIASGLDAVCNELNEIGDEFEAPNKRRVIDKPTETLTKHTASNIKPKPVDINQVRVWQRDIDSIVNGKTSVPLLKSNNPAEEHGASNKRRIITKTTEILTENTTSNINHKPVNMNQVGLWQLDVDSLVNQKTSLTPLKSNSTVKITNKTLNCVKEITPYGNSTNIKIKKPINNSTNGNKSTNTNELNINLQNKKTQHVQKSGKTFFSGKPLMAKNTDTGFNQVITPETSKVSPAKSSDIKNKQKNSLVQDNNSSATISDVIDSSMSNTIIIIEDTEKSDICKIIQIVQEEAPIVEISDDEEEPCSTQKVDLSSQKKIHNFQKGNYNWNKENPNPEKNNSKIDNDPNLDKICNVEKQLCNVNQEQWRFEAERSWINNDSNLFQNPETFTVDPANLVCDKCDKKFTTPQFLQRHLLYHSLNLELTDKPEKRTGCSEKITVEDVYRRAEQIRNSYNKTRTNPQKPSTIDSIDRTYKRPVVSMHGPRMQTLNRSYPAPPSQKYSEPLDLREEECKYCKTSINQLDLHRHIRRTHMAAYKSELRRFVRTYYKCNQCPGGYRNVPQMLSHMATQHKAKFACNHCDKHFNSRSPLIKHLHTSHGIKPTSLCYICGKMVNLANLSVHMKSHTNPKSMGRPVDNCNTVLNRKSSPKNIHRNEKSFMCEHCGKRFTKKNLTQHVRVHMDVLPYNCVICGKGFVQLSRLKRHLESHQHAKPYTCPVCPQVFGQKQSIKKHCIRYHPELGYTKKPQHLDQDSVVNSTKNVIECTLCERKFTYEYNLKKHTRIFHPMVYFNLKRKQLSKASTTAEMIDLENNY